MRIEVQNTEEFTRVEREAKARGQRITTLSRGKRNGEWILTLSDPPEQPELIHVDNQRLRVLSDRLAHAGSMRANKI